MKCLLIALIVTFLSCHKPKVNDGDIYTVNAYPAEKVNKQSTKKIFAHVMPWFESPETNVPEGTWGLHWTMNNQNPEIVDDSGRRQIAAHYYPLIGPYASGDKDVIEYQLLLMKLSGIDGIFIDWPGTTQLYDYSLLASNTESIIPVLEKTGLTFAIVYEDQNINIAYQQNVVTDKIEAARSDMLYLQQSYFNSPNYEKLNEKPFLLVFGPQTFQNSSDWTDIFSVLNDPKPAFFTLWFESAEAGNNASGEFGWVYKTHLTELNKFYSKSLNGIKIASAYPGFNSFYASGGWGGPTWIIEHDSLETFNQTLDLALKSASKYIQLVTWNDYGEGTMIEPTIEFGYGFLTTLQQKLQVPYGLSELTLARRLYDCRKKYKSSTLIMKKLDQVFYDVVSLKITDAENLLLTIESD